MGYYMGFEMVLCVPEMAVGLQSSTGLLELMLKGTLLF